jgi:hypothetical protein
MERKLSKNWLLQNKFCLRRKQSRLWLALFFYSLIGFSQVNYVGNPSFEDFNIGSCPPFTNYISDLKYWNSIDSVQKSAAGLTYNTCYPNLPLASGITYQWPKTGNGIIRLQVYCTSVTCTYTNSRLYPKNRLLSSLSAGATYCVKMNVNLQNTAPYAIDMLQILLADVSIDTTKYCKLPLTYLNPQITNTLGIINDTLNWIEVRNTFVANGTEKYLVIGNFKTDAATTTSATGLSGGVWSEYMIDDVSVIDFNLPAYAGSDQNIALGDSAFIGRPPEIGLECTWSSGTVTVGDGAGIWVKPTAPGTYSYVVTQNICGNIKTDTVNVNVSPGSINENTLFASSIGIYPQPAKDLVNISLSYFYGPAIEIRVTDVTGKIIRNVSLIVRNGKAQIETSEFSNGVYTLQIISKNQVAQKRLIIAK